MRENNNKGNARNMKGKESTKYKKNKLDKATQIQNSRATEVRSTAKRSKIPSFDDGRKRLYGQLSQPIRENRGGQPVVSRRT